MISELKQRLQISKENMEDEKEKKITRRTHGG
jgi:hypothetical protein